MNGPLVSVIIPVFNRESYLAAAIESVLAQDYSPYEIIVVDDGSSDGSAAIAKSYELARYIYQSNQGHAIAKNTGIAAATGEFIAFLDSDDIWIPNKLSAQVGYLIDNPAYGYAIALERLVLEPGVELPTHLNRKLFSEDHKAFVPSALIVRRSVLDQVGGFDSAYCYGNDTDWFLRAMEAGIRIGVVNEMLLIRRFHNSNQTNDAAGMRAEFFRNLKGSIDRRRKQSPAESRGANEDD